MLFLLACAAPPPEPPPAPKGPPNILLISLDTVRADHTTPYGYDRDTTPNLARVAALGTTFVNAFSQGNESAYSHGSLFTGRYASELADPTYATYALPTDATLVPEALSAYGYKTGGFSAGGHVTADFGFNQGWDTWSHEAGFASLYDTGPKALRWIGGQEYTQPWFAFVHAYDAHRPYTRPGPWDHLWARQSSTMLSEAIVVSPCLSEMVRDGALYPELEPTWFSHAGGAAILDPRTYARLDAAGPRAVSLPLVGDEIQHIVDHYDGALTYVDTLLGLFLAEAERTERLANTVVILVSDHGEDLLDHGYMNHRTGLYDSCTRVPLIVMGPGFVAGAEVEALVDARDVAATVLALGGAVPPAGSGGTDLRTIAAGGAGADAVFSEGVMDMVSVRTRTARLVYLHAPIADPAYVDKLAAAPLNADHFELFDVVADPEETKNLLLGDPGADAIRLATELRARLIEWRRSIKIGTYSLPQEDVDPAVAKQLREHGYWGAGASGGAKEAVAARTAAMPDRVDTKCDDRLVFLPGRENGPVGSGRGPSGPGQAGP